MKPIRQLYLGTFLAYLVFTALLFFPQVIVPHDIPHAFGTLAAGIIVTIIAQMVRCWKEGISLLRMIPAVVILLVCLAHIVGLFLWGSTAASREAMLLRFYLITALVNIAVSVVGFFLK